MSSASRMESFRRLYRSPTKTSGSRFLARYSLASFQSWASGLSFAEKIPCPIGAPPSWPNLHIARPPLSGYAGSNGRFVFGLEISGNQTAIFLPKGRPLFAKIGLGQMEIGECVFDLSKPPDDTVHPFFPCFFCRHLSPSF